MLPGAAGSKRKRPLGGARGEVVKKAKVTFDVPKLNIASSMPRPVGLQGGASIPADGFILPPYTGQDMNPPDFEEYTKCIFADYRSRARVWLDVSAREMPYQLDAYCLSRKDIYMAIASVLIGRRQELVNFAFVPPELFTVDSSDEILALNDDVRPFGSGDHLLIPISLDEDPPKDPHEHVPRMDHYPRVALAHAEVVKDGGSEERLRVHYYTSTYSDGNQDFDLTPFQEITNAILLRWERLGPNAHDVVEQSSEVFTRAPHAFISPTGRVTARLQLIANAWAIIYDLPVRDSSGMQFKAVAQFVRAMTVMVSLQTVVSSGPRRSI